LTAMVLPFQPNHKKVVSWTWYFSSRSDSWK